ncbi:hypothetical protein DFH06DRAFT_1484423 [Mycena polygramma]|nr:hypothetical protein DFH06DRAFT_1484423 [Mycena polygramma]
MNNPSTPTRGTPKSTSTEQKLSSTGSTPQNHGSGSHASADINATRAVYAPYLAEDVAKEVSLTLADFLIHILHVPSDHKDPKIDKLVGSAGFKKRLQKYTDVEPSKPTTKEQELYQPFVELANYCLEQLGLGNKLVFCRNDHQSIQGSSAGRSPDVVGVHPSALKSGERGRAGLTPDSMSKNGPEKFPFHWCELQSFWEFKPEDVKDPKPVAAKPVSAPKTVPPPKPARNAKIADRSSESQRVLRSATKAAQSQQSAGGSRGASAGGSRGASAGGSRGASAGSSRSWAASTSGPRGVAGGALRNLEPTDPKIQCASYALELLSNGGLRSHAIGVLVSLHSLELLYYDHSIIVKSDRLRFVDKPALFVSVLQAFGNLTVAQWGCPALAKAPDHPALLTPPTPLVDLPLQTKRAKDYMHVDDTLSVTGWTFKVREIISRAHGIIGRGTVVVRAQVTHCPPDKNLVGQDVAVKWSWISRSRLPETEFVKAAVKYAEQTDRGMLNHLPKIYHSEDLEWLAPPSQTFLVERFENEYEDRVLRVIVQELLEPIVQLEPQELALAFKGVVKCHRWLYETAKILQRDVSVDNLMFRTSKEGTVYGVLNDYDLAEFYKPEPQPPSSKQRTGTKPYMAIDLLVRNPPKHQYRHDLESFLYVLVFLTCEIGRSDLDTWNNLGMDGLRKDKTTAMNTTGFPRQTPECAVFYGWVGRLRALFRKGYAERERHQEDLQFGGAEGAFDELTLGGVVTGDAFEAILDLGNLATRKEDIETHWASRALEEDAPVDYRLR